MTKFSIRKNRANIVGSFPSLKNATSVYYESTIERDLLFFLEYDQSVSSYHMHPFTISYDDRETHHSYTPDVLVVRSTTKTLIECKPKTLLDDPHTQQQIMIGSQWCEQHNHIFEVITDRDLRENSRLPNLKLLWRYARITKSHEVRRHVSMLFSNIEELSFKTLANQLRLVLPHTIPEPHIYFLLFSHFLLVDLAKPLTPDSLIYLA